MPWPIRLGPQPRMITLGSAAGRDLGLLVVGGVVVRRLARRTRRRRCRRSCRPAGCRARAAAADDVFGRCRGSRRSARRRSRAAWPAAARSAVELAARRRSRRRLLDAAGRAGRGTTGRSRWPRRPPRRSRRPAAPAARRAAGRRAGVRTRRAAARPCRPSSPCPVEDGALLLQRAQRLLQRLGEVAADRHRLADRLHVRGQRRVGARELLEREPRHLHHDVVERRLEAAPGSRAVMSLGISSRV